MRKFVVLAPAALLGLAAVAPVAAQSTRGGALPAQAGFGNALAVGTNAVFVGEAQNDASSGYVYVYGRGSGGRWAEQAKLHASDAANADRFGADVATSGDFLLVGATAADTGIGAAYVFQRRGGSWSQLEKLVSPAPVKGDGFGSAVAISGDIALVGAFGTNENAGAVHVYRRHGGGWSATGVLAPADLAKNDRFGSSVALDGTTAVIGAPRQDGLTGAAYVFDVSGTAGGSQTAKLTTRLATRNAGFGSSIALRGSDLMIGAPRANTFSGLVVGYTRDSASGEWRESGALMPFDGGRGQFGSAVAFNPTTVAVGAPGAGGFEGRVYLYTRDSAGGEWNGSSKLAPSGVSRGDRFAGTLAMGDGLLAVGLPGSDYGLGKAAMFERDATGAWTERGAVASMEEGYAAITGKETRCDGGKISAFDCGAMDLVSFLPRQDMMGERGARLNDVWGWTDSQTGKEYAIVGRMDGTTFVDISNPASPRVVGNLPKTPSSPGSTWRDMKVYKDHVFVVADGAGEHGMQVFNLAHLRNARTPQTFSPDAHYTGIASSHNIVINEGTGFAYAVGASGGGETCGGGLHMINIQEPTRPTFAGCFSDPQTGRASTGYSHDAQCVVYNGPDPDYQGREICIGANETAISVADVTDKANPKAISRASYPNVGYAHQGWFTEDQKYWYLDDELDELQGNADRTRTMIWDLTDLDDPVLAKEHFGTTAASDHNLYIKGNMMYQSNYVAGLRVLDISDPVNPREVGYFDTVPVGDNSAGFGGSWSNYPYFASGVIAVTSGSEGVFFLRQQQTPLP